MEGNEWDQLPLFTPEFAENPEPRCACLLLLDTSGSMSGEPIQQLNEAVSLFIEELQSDPLASKRVELGIVTFGPVNVVSEFHNPDMMIAPALQATGATPMGEAIETAVKMVEDRKQLYRSNGMMYYRPWIFMITDGSPTDAWQNAAALVKEGENSKKFAFFSVGVDSADMSTLGQISSRTPLKLKGLRFRELFQWLSSSLKSVSRSRPDEEVALQNPVTPEGWATV